MVAGVVAGQRRLTLTPIIGWRRAGVSSRASVAPADQASPRTRRFPPGRRRTGWLARAVATAAATAVVAAGATACSPDGGGPTAVDRSAPSDSLSGAGATFSADPKGQPPVIATAGGLVSGIRAGQVDRYHAIPFAAPPVGMLRWAAPTPSKPWQGIRDGSRGAPACTQTGTLSALSSEDCLYLAVSRPAGAPTSGHLPVIFWIHGGAFVGGTGEQADPTALTTGGPAIVVTTNYRLGALGYLVLPSLTQESGGDAGNYATQDLTAALGWVRNNAAAFGGDPKNVTIMGESAGSINVCALLAAPAASGLFQRAVMESGPCGWKLPTMAAAAQTGSALASRLGCVDAATAALCLRFHPAAEIMTAAAADGSIFNPFPFSPAVGGKTLPFTPYQALWNGKLADVPILMGTVHDEGRPFTTYWANQGPITDFGVDGIIRTQFPDRAERVLAAYPPGQVPARERLSRIITDSMFTCQATTFAQLTTAIARMPTYLYEFDVPERPAASSEFGTGATHGAELDFLFPGLDGRLTTSAQHALSTSVVGYWTRFAATGNPNGSGEATSSTVPWPLFDVQAVRSGDDRLLLTPGRTVPATDTWSAHHCDVWS
ncbi:MULTISPECIES: carboxylesterase/lipase family protein [Pseudofrankia]|uniref:carboxylesterase/lipase family protein n=1 Tax=Pseudofrankia TaxID=2994363 RepID=UPI0006860818|nr:MULTISPECIES: carboxylesterase family protein [Pseudofrankia]